MRILVTGSRHWTDQAAMIATFRQWAATLPPEAKRVKPTVVHGAARGADVMAALLALRWGWKVEAHPADWDQYGRAAGMRRNAEMVASGADVCLAFPIGKSLRTRECMQLAKAAGISVIVCEGRLVMPVPRKGEQR